MSRLPERDTRPGRPTAASSGARATPLIAVIFILVFTVGPYLAFTGHVPFTSYGYELKATFSNSANISLNSPVRIAGVDVGKVISAEPRRQRDHGHLHGRRRRPADPRRRLRRDPAADLPRGQLLRRPRPRQPERAGAGSGGTIPVSHTSTAVQLDEVLTALQSPVRADLGRLLEGYGTALTHKPTAAEDLTQLPEVKGMTGAGALNSAFKYGGEAGRYTAQVTNALLGTEPTTSPAWSPAPVAPSAPSRHERSCRA